MSLRKKLKDDFKIMINDPRADFARSRNKARQDLENSIQKDARAFRGIHGSRAALDLYHIDHLNRSVRK